MDHVATRRIFAFCLSSLATTCAFAAEPATSANILNQPTAQATPRVEGNYGKLPLSFEPNQGQTDPQVKFLSRGSGYSLFLTPTEAVLALQKPAPDKHEKSSAAHNSAPPASILTMKLVGGNPTAQITGSDQQPGKSNYFLGNDPTKWHTNISNYSQVSYKDIYPGIDLVYYGNQRQLEHDFIVAPGANAKTITLAFEGAKKISLNAHGDLLLATKDGEVQLKQPVLYQQIAGVKQPIPGRYILRGKNRIGFAIPAYDHNQPLVIDPILFYSTYLGGSISDVAQGVAIDTAGNAYVTGYTRSSDFPTTPGALQTTFPTGGTAGGPSSAFVSKLNATGTALLYSTYLGGSGNTRGNAITVDAAGDAYVTGATNSPNFPFTPDSFQFPADGGFVAKLNPTGSALLYAAGVGGFAIAVDASGNAYLGGVAGFNFPTTPGAFQTTFGGFNDGYIAKLNPSGMALVYATFLGGNDNDSIYSIAVDGSGNAYVTGATTSTNFPTTAGSFQPASGGGSGQVYDAFVSKLNAAGSALLYSSYLGGTGQDVGYGIAVDASGNAYVTGRTNSPNFATTSGAFQTALGGPCNPDDFNQCQVQNAYITKVNPTGSALVYSTYLGGGGNSDQGLAIVIDSSGNAYVAGDASSANFPTTPGAYQTTLGGVGRSSFVSKLNPAGSALLYATYLNSALVNQGNGIAIDATGNAYVTGSAGPNFFTTPGAFQPTLAGNPDAFVIKLSLVADLGRADLSIAETATSHTAVPGGPINYAISLNNFGPNAASSVVVIDVLPPQQSFVSCTADAGGTCTNTNGTVTITFPTIANAHSAYITILTQVAANVPGNVTLLNASSIASATTDPNPGNNSASVVTSIRYTADLSIQKTIVVSPAPGELKYLISVTAPSPAHGVTINDPLPSGTTFVSATTTQGTCTTPSVGANGTVTCALGNMPANTSATVFVTVNVTAPSGTTISNTATVFALTFDPHPANNSSTITTTVP